MLIAYDSRTGNVARFIGKLGLTSVRVTDGLVLQEPFVLVTYTTGFGKVPDSTLSFLKRNSRFLRGVAASGNRNWGDGFAKSADLIAEQCRVPVLSKFELSGTRREVEEFTLRLAEVAAGSAAVAAQEA